MASKNSYRPLSPSNVTRFVIDCKVQEYKDSVKNKGELLILQGFPETIVRLNDILETPQFSNRELTNLHQDLNIAVPNPVLNHTRAEPPTVKRPRNSTEYCPNVTITILPSDLIPLNKNVVELIEIVKPHIRKLVEDSKLLKTWISFMIPKIEDGNNFGVGIQEDTLNEIEYAAMEGMSYYNQISRYFIARGKLISKVVKYPHIIDYRRAVQELDDKEFLTLCRNMTEVRNHYTSLHDTVLKNIEKIKKPRSTNVVELLY